MSYVYEAINKLFASLKMQSKMKATEIDINRFRNIEDFYDFIDENAILLERNLELTDLWVNFRNFTNSEVEKQMAQWELECFLFNFKGNSLFSFSYSTGSNIGEVKKYPELDEFQNAAFDYLAARSKKAKSNILLARYNHLLWKGLIKKNRNHAIAAIENYHLCIKDFYHLVIKENDSGNNFQIGKLYETLVALYNETKHQSENLKELTDFLLYKADNIQFYTKHGIIEDMLQYPKVFKHGDYINTISLFEERLVRSNENTDDFSLINYHLPTAIKIAQKTKTDIKKWYNEIGNACVRLAVNETDESRNWIKLSEYNKAIQAFRLAGNIAKRKEIEQLYFELKPNVKLDTYRIDYDEETIKVLQELQEELKSKAKIILTEKPDVIYSIISKGTFFPQYDDILNAAKNVENSFLDFATTIFFNNNKNISDRNSKENKTEEIFKIYDSRMKETLLPFLHYIFILGIKSGHLTYKNFIEYLINHTWIGIPQKKIDLGGDIEITNWVKLITPAIVEFFVQVSAWGESKYYIPNFILCIDSLTLKIEGLFRSFSERVNVSTSISKQKGVQEALIHNILDNEIIRKYFDENDRLLFDYVFSNEGGLNLRNNVAHSFYNEHEFHPDKMLLLLAILLRLGKYNIKSKNLS